MVGAVLTQNTAWTNVEKAIANLHGAEAMEAERLLAVPAAQLAEWLRPAGLFSVKGSGPETADDILLYAFHRPVFVIDAYTRRILTRLGLARGDETYEQL